ncbi:hypothetical protein, partial [Streptococcus suis]
GKELDQDKKSSSSHPPAQLIRPDLECKTRTNSPINHCAEMLTRTLSGGPGLFAQPLGVSFSSTHYS